jgi:hypothetical protein
VVIKPDAVSVETLDAALTRIEGDRAAFEVAARRLQASFTEVTGVGEAVGRALALMDMERSLG